MMARKKTRSITLTGCPFSEQEIVRMVEPHPDLRRLVLEYCEIGDTGLARLAGLVNLRELDLSDTRVTGPGLVHLARMVRAEHLKLAGLPIGDADLDHLRPMTRLRSLKLDRTSV